MATRSHLWPDPRVKPPYGAAELDRGHPLTQHLYHHWAMNEGGGVVRDPVRAQDGTLSGTTKPGWRASGRGLGLEFDGTSSFIVNQTVLNTARVTLAVQFRFFTLPGALVIKKICGFSDGNASGTLDKELTIGRTSTNTLDWFVYDGAPKSASDAGGALAINQTHVAVGTADGTTSRLYRDGVQVGSVAAGSTFTGYAVANVIAGGTASDHEYLAQIIDWMGVWTEALPANHVLWLSKEPYAMYRPLVRRRYIVPATGGSTIPRKMHHYAGMR